MKVFPYDHPILRVIDSRNASIEEIPANLLARPASPQAFPHSGIRLALFPTPLLFQTVQWTPTTHHRFHHFVRPFQNHEIHFLNLLTMDHSNLKQFLMLLEEESGLSKMPCGNFDRYAIYGTMTSPVVRTEK